MLAQRVDHNELDSNEEGPNESQSTMNARVTLYFLNREALASCTDNLLHLRGKKNILLPLQRFDEINFPIT